MNKLINVLILISVVLMSMGIVSAGEIVREDGGTVFVYGQIEDTVRMSKVNDEIYNFNKTVCINATVIEGEISISGTDEYELEYIFIADINDSSYISRTLTIKQKLISSSFLTGKILNRTLTLDGNEIGNYETKASYWSKPKRNVVYFNLIDNNIRFGKDVIVNASLAFTQLNYQDQQNYLLNVTQTYPKFPIHHKYITVGIDDESSQKLTGLTGWVYNGIGAIPWALGTSLQGMIFLPLSIIQYTFNFIFSFIVLIYNNWWYSILLMEIFCIFKALKYHSYTPMVGAYIDTHVHIFDFMYHKVILPLMNQILRLIEVIRNLFRI